MPTQPDENRPSPDPGDSSITAGAAAAAITPSWSTQSTSQIPAQPLGIGQNDSRNQFLPNLQPREVLERRSLGYVLLLISIIAVIVTSCTSLQHVDSLKPVKRQPSALDYVKLSVRGSITVAFVFFCYGMMQAGERLLIPDKWIRTSDDLKMIVGIKPPSKMTSDDVKSLFDFLKKLTKKNEE